MLFLGGRVGKTGKLAQRSRYAIVLLFSTYWYFGIHYQYRTFQIFDSQNLLAFRIQVGDTWLVGGSSANAEGKF